MKNERITVTKGSLSTDINKNDLERYKSLGWSAEGVIDVMDNLGSMKLTELKHLADSKGIVFKSSIKKMDLILLLESQDRLADSDDVKIDDGLDL